MTSAWLQRFNATPASAADSRAERRLRLVCCAASGCGASTFQVWLKHLPPWLELAAVQLPGRERRAREPALRRLEPIVDALAAEIRALHDRRPFALFGHSLGGRIAFELARRLEADGGQAPAHVILAASMEASAMTELDRRCHLLGDEEFCAYVAAFGGFPEELRRYPRQFKAVLELLRADLEIFATSAPAPEPRLRAPLTVWVARDDRALTRAAVEPWAQRTAGRFALEWSDGGHFFPIERAAESVGRLAALLAPPEVA